MNVLVIDNSILFHEILSGVFTDTNIHPIVCDNADDGLDILQHQSVDFICVSMFLKGIDGLRLIKKIRKKSQYIHTPIILFTSEESNDIYIKALSSGCTEVFHKKYLSQLVNFIQRFTLQQQQLSGRILYIEDTLSQQKIITSIFENKGLIVDAFSSAEEALIAYQKNDYSIVVTDIILDGGMTGMSLINRIRRLDGMKGEIPILALTAFDDISRRIDLFYLGVSDYVIKPIIEEELLARVRNLMNSQRYHLEALEQKKLAEKASKTKSDFLSNMSHEMRTPMHGILSYARMGIKQIKTLSPEKNLRYFNNIKTSADRLMSLLNDLLDLAKLEAGKMELNFKHNILQVILQGCIEEQQSRLDDLQIKVIQQSTDFMGEGIFDHVKIGQVITNLLSNAIKFSPKQSSISFSISKTSTIFDGRNEVEAIQFTIVDQGKGLPMGEEEVIFDKFIQSSNSATGLSKGTGLGLPICKEIISLHQGKIWADNHPSEGAIFTFIIPISQAVKAGIIDI